MYQILHYFLQPELRIFLTSLLFLGSLYFSPSNKFHFLLSLLYCASIYFITKKLRFALFCTFLLTLPFPKGKAIEFPLLTREENPRYALFDIIYFFPLYISDFYLLTLIYSYVREWRIPKLKSRIVSHAFISSLLFFLFILLNLFNSARAIYPNVVFFSSLQLIKVFLVLHLPHLLKNDFLYLKKHFVQLITSLALFESGWGILQFLKGGPLGKDIESQLKNFHFGIFSSENPDLLRVTGTFFEANMYAAFLLILITYLLYSLLSHKHSSRQLVLVVSALIFLLIAIVASGSRGTYGLFFILAGTLLWRFRQHTASKFLYHKAKKHRQLIIIGLMVIGVLFSSYLSSRLYSLTDVLKPGGSLTYRYQMIQYALRMGSLHPLGIGLSLSPFYYATAFIGENFVFDTTYPHNLLIQIYAETGVIGFLIFSLFIYFSLFKKTMTAYGFAALALFLCLQLYPIFLNHPEVSTFLFVLLGLHLYSNTQPKHAT